MCGAALFSIGFMCGAPLFSVLVHHFLLGFMRLLFIASVDALAVLFWLITVICLLLFRFLMFRFC